MATEFCQRCKQSHPGRVCDYDEKGECVETVETQETSERKRSNGMPQRRSELSSDPEEEHTDG